MVRALFGGYSGRLYQVQRASDGQTKDIGTLTTGGYADSGSQDSFCQGTTCAIKIIYDQTSNNNDLPVTGGLSMAVANAIPITLNGNNKVYGLKITSGTGYRNNATQCCHWLRARGHVHGDQRNVRERRPIEHE
jgi:hypothetical protein